MKNKKIMFTHMYRMYSLSGQHSAVSGIPDSTGCRVCHVNVKTCTGTVKFSQGSSDCLNLFVSVGSRLVARLSACARLWVGLVL